MFGALDRLLSENRIEFVKWDMNRSFSEPGWPDAFRADDNPERAWTDYVHHLYAVFDALRAAHPGVEFESCASGGGRVDLGILRRVEQVWTSDNTDAWDRVKIQEGFTQAYPPQAMMAWVTDRPNYLTKRELPLRFRFHVAMAGALGVGGDLLRWTQAELAEAAELIATYKEIRPVVQRGRLYRLASVLGGPAGAPGASGLSGVSGAFAASQYVAGDDVVLLAWWGPQPGGARPSRIRLAALDPSARYQEIGTGREHSGAALLTDGLPLPEETASTFGSTLVRLVRH
jgi:alpha-galactosidase